VPRSVEAMDPGWSETDEEIIQRADRAREKEQRVAKRAARLSSMSKWRRLNRGTKLLLFGVLVVFGWFGYVILTASIYAYQHPEVCQQPHSNPISAIACLIG